MMRFILMLGFLAFNLEAIEVFVSDARVEIEISQDSPTLIKTKSGKELGDAIISNPKSAIGIERYGILNVMPKKIGDKFEPIDVALFFKNKHFAQSFRFVPKSGVKNDPIVLMDLERKRATGDELEDMIELQKTIMSEFMGSKKPFRDRNRKGKIGGYEFEIFRLKSKDYDSHDSIKRYFSLKKAKSIFWIEEERKNAYFFVGVLQ